MSRYLIEREFPDGLSIPQDEGGASKAVRRAAARNKLPISRITGVRALDPHFCR
jgi:hypothetical protein